MRDINITHSKPILGRRRESDLTGLNMSTSTSQRTSSRCFIYDNPSDSYFSQVSSSPTAVNMKTGSSVFTLDFNTDSIGASKATNNNHQHQGSKPTKLSRKKQQSQQGQAGVFKLSKTSTGSMDTNRRASKTGIKATKSDDDWLQETFGKGTTSSSSSNQGNDPAFCVTPLLTSRMERPGRMELDSEDDFSRSSPDDDFPALKVIL